MKFIIDTDLGIDDAIAFLMILGHPQADIEAITTVVGNIPLAQATHNVGVVLNAAQAPPIPIFQGCGKPLMQNEPLHAMDFHGSDGLGGVGQSHPNRSIEAEHAVTALIRLARAHSGQVSLLTLGPLTNIALAIRLAPDFLSHFERVVMMAGAVDGRGNTSEVAEFNIAVDPEAAAIAFEACQQVADRVWLVSWEASLNHATPLETWHRFISGDTAQAKFVQAMSQFAESVVADYGYSAIPWADPLAAAVALEPEIVTAYDTCLVQVDVGHTLARGSTIPDYRSRHRPITNMKIVRAVDLEKFEAILQLVV
jgi:purine nucleosidase